MSVGCGTARRGAAKQDFFPRNSVTSGMVLAKSDIFFICSPWQRRNNIVSIALTLCYRLQESHFATFASSDAEILLQ